MKIQTSLRCLKETNYDDVLDSFVQAMGTGTPSRQIGLDPVPDIHTYNTSTPVGQL